MIKTEFLKTYLSPFQPLNLSLYIGKIKYGTPYFYPRKWVKNKDKPGYLKPKPKKIGFDFVPLGWKTKWRDNDYRFEWEPIWSFVFFKWQIVIRFRAPERDHYWECWLYYHLNTDNKKSKELRIQECIKNFPCIWNEYSKSEIKTINYYYHILKPKYHYLIK